MTKKVIDKALKKHLLKVMPKEFKFLANNIYFIAYINEIFLPLEKDRIISTLKIKNRELEKNINELVNKINNLTQILTELGQKNQNIKNENEKIKNTIFNIDGIIEAKSKEGQNIPLLKEIRNEDMNEDVIYCDIKEIKGNLSSKYQNFKDEKSKSFSISNSDEQNSDI